MKKVMLGMFTVALLFTSCSDSDDEGKVENDSILLKTEQTIESQAEELSIEANNNIEWWIDGLMLTDSTHTGELIENLTKADTLEGEWYTIIREEEGKSLYIEADENNEKTERQIKISLTTSEEGTPEQFTLIQKKEEVEVEE